MGKKILILIVLVLVCLAGLIAAFVFLEGSDEPTDHSILVCLVDPSEHSPGLGAVDFAFVVQLKNYSVTNMTSIYPTGPGMEHPTADPALPMTNLLIKRLYLHDSLYDVPLEVGVKHAQEIVEYNKGIKTDSVVIINPKAVDAILDSIGGVDVNGTHVTNNSIVFLRDEQYFGHISRPDIVESMGNAIKDASKDKNKRNAMIQAITVQYAEGNILVVPSDLFVKLMSGASVKSLFG